MAYQKYRTKQRYDPIAVAEKRAAENGKMNFDKDIRFEKDGTRAIRFDRTTSEVVFKAYVEERFFRNNEWGSHSFRHELRIPAGKEAALAFIAEEMRSAGVGTYGHSRGQAFNKRFDPTRNVYVADGMEYEYCLAVAKSKDEKFCIDSGGFRRLERDKDGQWVASGIQPRKTDLIVRVNGLGQKPKPGLAGEVLGVDPTGRQIAMRIIDDMGGETMKRLLSTLVEGKGVEITARGYQDNYTSFRGVPSAEAVVDEAGILAVRSIDPPHAKVDLRIDSDDRLTVEERPLMSGRSIFFIKDKEDPLRRIVARDPEMRACILEVFANGGRLAEVNGTEKTVVMRGRFCKIYTVEDFSVKKKSQEKSLTRDNEEQVRNKVRSAALAR